MNEPQIDITVSIVNWNTRDELAKCLTSVLAQEGVSIEVIVVDNNSKDGSSSYVRQHFPGVKLITNDKNLGFSKAHNQSLMVSSGRYFMLLNPDALLPEEDVLAKLVAFGDANPTVAIVGPRVVNTDGSLQFSARRFPTIAAALFRRTPLGKLFPRNRFVREYIMADWAHDEVRDVDWVSGSALMIRREAEDEIGPLDDGYFMYVEDVDWCYRAKQAGWRVCYYPMTTVVHRIGAASDQAPIPMIHQFHRSMFRFYLKHYAKGARAILAPVVLLALAARAIFFIILTRIPISSDAQESGERLVR